MDVLKELFMNVMELHHFYAALDTTPASGRQNNAVLASVSPLSLGLLVK
jgi:hypothetical protein